MLHKQDDIEAVLIELNAGIVPTCLFFKNMKDGKDTFESMDENQAKSMKRRWRKLKKKFGVKKTGLESAAWKIRKGLREECNEVS